MAVKPLRETIFSLRGNKSIMAVSDSQVVRLDVSAGRVVRLGYQGSSEVRLDVFSDIFEVVWSGWMFFRFVSCETRIGVLQAVKKRFYTSNHCCEFEI